MESIAHEVIVASHAELDARLIASGRSFPLPRVIYRWLRFGARHGVFCVQIPPQRIGGAIDRS